MIGRCDYDPRNTTNTSTKHRHSRVAHTRRVSFRGEILETYTQWSKSFSWLTTRNIGLRI